MGQLAHAQLRPGAGAAGGDLLSLRRHSAACAAARLSPRQPQHGSQQRQQPPRQRQPGATAVLAPPPPPPPVKAVAATPVRPDQPGLADFKEQIPNAIAYQGVPGAYSEVAALATCPGWTHVPCNQFEQVFQSLSQWSADRAVLPIENSLGGSIHANLDLMLRYRLHIVGETLVDVNHCLLALPGTRLEDLERVISHPQALSQCDGYLRALPNPKGVREAVFDTAGAAMDIANNQRKNVAAVASKRAAELYGLEVLDEAIQDNRDNVTRFIVLAREPLVVESPAPGGYKTSIVFSMQEGPGQLYRAMSAFALRDINMTKLESRPLRSSPILYEMDNGRRSYNYVFFIDFIGSTAETKVQNALKNLEEYATFMRVLGSYPISK